MPSLYDYDLKMKTEDVETNIVLATAWKYPLTGLIKHEKPATNKLFRWGGRVNPATPPKSYYEGQDQTATAHEQSTPMYGLMQEMREPWGVGQQAEHEKTYTSENDPAAQKKMALARLYGQLEVVLGSFQEQRDGADNVAPLLRGAFAALSPYKAVGDVQQEQVFPTAMRCDSAHIFTGDMDDFNKAALSVILNRIYTLQNEPVNLMNLCGISLKEAMSNWLEYDAAASALINVNTRTPGQKFEVDNTVDVFNFEAGVVRNMLSNSLALDLTTGLPTAVTPWAGLLMNPDNWKIRQNMPLEHVDLPNLGGGRKGFYRFIKGLQCTMPRKNGYIMPSSFGSGSGSSDSSASA